MKTTKLVILRLGLLTLAVPVCLGLPAFGEGPYRLVQIAGTGARIGS